MHSRTNRRAVFGIVVVALLAGACQTKAADSHTSNTIEAGQLNIQLPSGWKVVHHHVISAPSSSGSTSGGAAGAAGGSTGTTVPLAKQNPTTSFFSAIHVFQGCLSGLGVTFIGAPNPKDPNSPANNPTYLKALTTCAAKSNIVQALKDEQNSQNNLTQAQIATENKVYIKWRVCMIGRGWQIPPPSPNSKGELFSFGTGSGNTPQLKPPPGQSLFNSPDLQQCIAKAQKEVPGASNLGG